MLRCLRQEFLEGNTKGAAYVAPLDGAAGKKPLIHFDLDSAVLRG